MFSRLVILAADPTLTELQDRIDILIAIAIATLVALVSIWLGQRRLAKNQIEMARLLEKQNRD